MIFSIGAFAEDNDITVHDGTLTVVKNVPKDGTLTSTVPPSVTPVTPLLYEIVDEPAHGAVVITDAEAGEYTYTPAADYVGTDSFTFRLTNGTLTSVNDAVITITVESDVPIAADKDITTVKNTPVTDTLPGIFPSSIDEADFVYQITTDVIKCTLSDFDPVTGSFKYTPDADYVGTDSFTYKITDTPEDMEAEDAITSNYGTINITVTEPAPVRGMYADLWGDYHWAEEAVLDLTDRGVISGEKIGDYHYFYPGRILNRIEYILMANSAFGFDTDITPDTIKSHKLPFVDVSGVDGWVIMAASAAYDNDLIRGHQRPDGLYLAPYEGLTRIEAFMMVYNVLDITDHSTAAITFKDKADIPSWADQMVKDMVANGLIKGSTDGNLYPNEVITRAEAAQILYEALGEPLKDHGPAPVLK